MIRGWRAIVMAVVLALGVTGIGATAVFGMTVSSATALASVDAGSVPEDMRCLFHCLAENDVYVSSGVLGVVEATIVAVFAAVSMICIVVVSAPRFARAVPVVYGSPGRRYFISRRD